MKFKIVKKILIAESPKAYTFATYKAAGGVLIIAKSQIISIMDSEIIINDVYSEPSFTIELPTWLYHKMNLDEIMSHMTYKMEKLP